MMYALAQLKTLYKSINTKSSQKERFDSVLEPFQAVLQLCLLSKSPNNTKLSIEENTLKLQPPHLSQGLIRWSRDDKKSDLMFLFQVCRRFPKLYKETLANIKKGKHGKNLYEVMTRMAATGLKKLAQTYAKRNGEHVIPQMLHLYCNVLLKPDIFGIVQKAEDLKCKVNVGNATDSVAMTRSNSSRKKYHEPSPEESQIDAVFCRLKSKIYQMNDFWVVYHCLAKLSNTEPVSKGFKEPECIISSLNEYFRCTNARLRDLLLKSIVV